ncbi:hypothetical protein OHC33_000543 [Knufia fluminis]|uniref:Cell cycle inhibitor Nif1 n=1 Tax=Knufia fluminis TaxID=191047 RepID=A0AAN8ICK6_9EURO|nr:hypothetical protein OHC33_000543 [Knufia fluminis]
MERPTFIDISATTSRAPSSAGTLRTGQPSPRIQHFDGDVPPILSPLDAFAAESRRLAKELEATRIAGERRMSRLPPAVITKSLSKHLASRPACFRSLSNNSTDSLPPLPQPELFKSGNSPEVNEPSQRPKSSYPQISAESQHDEEYDTFETPREHPLLRHPHDYFEIRRTQSPPTLSERNTRPPSVARTPSGNSQTRDYSALAPPVAPFAKNKLHHDSSDDDYLSSNGGSTFSAPLRKSSNGSAMSYTASPALYSHHERSPSAKSTGSQSSLSKGKAQYNFSRPLSQASLNLQLESPTSAPGRFLERKPSHLSEETRGFTSFEDDRSIISDGYLAGTSSSYTHKKFVLPRGKLSEKASQRVSQLFSGLSGPTFGWQEPVFPGTPPLSSRTENGGLFEYVHPSTLQPSFDPSKPNLDDAPKSPAHTGFSFGFEENKRGTSDHHERPSSSRTAPEAKQVTDASLQRPSTSYNASSFDRSKMPALPPIPVSTADDMSMRSSRPDTATQRSASTVRPTTVRSHSDYQALSADEHVDKAIDLHHNGDLKESTYHLRIAAKQNHPTGMLLYALACRHGWGMRANPREGVVLLRKAVDIAMQEVADDEDSSSTRPKADFMEQKSHRAQFALAIYELGISHLNGWGVEQDKALALRCFEIAGNWGDADALTEAGFCYAEGVGCKKNLRKAAKFYRQAAEKGVSMVGNSWIYKDKYNDNDDKNDRKTRSRKASTNEEEKKPRSKSKTRSIFGRKRGNTMKGEQSPAQPSVSMESSRA